MATGAGQPRASNFLQVVILALLGVILVLVVKLHIALNAIEMQKEEGQFLAIVEAPVSDLGVSGKVVSVNTNDRTFEIEQKRTTGQKIKRTIQVTDETVIRIAGKESKLNDLKEGFNIRFKATTDEKGIMRATQITAQPPVQ